MRNMYVAIHTLTDLFTCLPFFPVPKVSLGGPCSGDDVCLDGHAVCSAGRCRCLKDFQVQQGVCGQYILLNSYKF